MSGGKNQRIETMTEATQETTQVAQLPLTVLNKVMTVLGSLQYHQVAELIEELRAEVKVTAPPTADDVAEGGDE